MKKIIITIKALFIFCNMNICCGQFSISFDVGYNLNHLKTDVSNRLFTKNKSINGYGTNIYLNYNMSDKFKFQSGIGLLQKNYSMVRTNYYAGIFERFNNTFLQIPLIVQFRMFKIQKLKIHLNGGIYGAFWTYAKLKGSIPNMFDSEATINTHGHIVQYFSFTKYSEKYTFSYIKDNRFEFGLVSGISLSYDLTHKYSIFLQPNYYHTITDLQKRYMINQKIKSNRTFCISIGYSIKL